MGLLIKNSRVIDPANNIDDNLDILIDGIIIQKIAKGIKADNSVKIIDAKGRIVNAGLNRYPYPSKGARA